MAETLSLQDVFDLARTMETNAVDFYTRAADTYKNIEDGRFFLRLAKMEEDHEKTFARMQGALPEQTDQTEKTDDVFEASGFFLKALIDSENLEGSGFARYIFTGEETPSQVILMGIDLEKETILYYMGINDLFPDPEDKKVLEAIVKEEKDHLATLIQEYQKLQTQKK